MTSSPEVPNFGDLQTKSEKQGVLSGVTPITKTMYIQPLEDHAHPLQEHVSTPSQDSVCPIHYHTVPHPIVKPCTPPIPRPSIVSPLQDSVPHTLQAKGPNPLQDSGPHHRKSRWHTKCRTMPPPTARPCVPPTTGQCDPPATRQCGQPMAKQCGPTITRQCVQPHYKTMPYPLQDNVPPIGDNSSE